jgi:hypothetical protein
MLESGGDHRFVSHAQNCLWALRYTDPAHQCDMGTIGMTLAELQQPTL